MEENKGLLKRVADLEERNGKLESTRREGGSVKATEELLEVQKEVRWSLSFVPFPFPLPSSPHMRTPPIRAPQL